MIQGIWAKYMPFTFIEALSGRKILLRENDDMFWDAKKTARLNEQFKGRLEFLQNNFYGYEDYALVGTKGYVNGISSITYRVPVVILFMH